MNETLKVLDQKGVEYLWSKISMQDYPNNETLISVINAIDETKANKSEIKQSDWNQNDSAEMDYIKNKPFYYTPTDTYTIETPEINTYYLLWDFGASEDEFLSSIYKNELSYANITKIPGRPLDNPLYEGAIQYSIAYIGFQSNDGFDGGRYMCDAVSQFASISSKIDDVNYYIFYPSIKYYFILDTTALNTEYQEIFTQCGIYVITNNNMPYTILNATFEIGSSTTLAQRFIPSSIARLNDIPTLDNTLLISGAAADAEAVGNALTLKADKTDIVNPDFAQNDSTQSNYIKNRTHYAEINSVEILPETSITTSSNQYGTAGQIGFVDGKTYTIVWDGVEYRCVAGNVEYNGLPVVAVGNTIFIGGADTGEPFAICDIPVNNYMGFAVLTDGTYTVSIFGEQEVVHTLDKKYLPNQKLSDFENDLYYPAKREAFITLTPADFILDEEFGCYVYTTSPKLDWLTSADVIGFELINTRSETLTEDTLKPTYEVEDGACFVNFIPAVLILVNGTNITTGEIANAYSIFILADAINEIKSFTLYKKTLGKKIPEECLDIPTPNALIFTGGVTDSYDGSQKKTIKIPTKLPNPYELQFMGSSNVSYNGNAMRTINIVGKNYDGSHKGEIFNDYFSNIASGDYSHAEGYSTIASGDYSHAEGYSTIASGKHSHAEGRSTIASGDYSHAEGYSTHSLRKIINGDANATTYTINSIDWLFIGCVIKCDDILSVIVSIDSTNSTITVEKTLSTVALVDKSVTIYITGLALGYGSHSEGCNTVAVGFAQHVQGKYNIIDPDYSLDATLNKGKYAHIVGNGDFRTPSNAHTIDWDGNAWFQGNIKIGGTGQDDEIAKELATKEYVDAPKTEFILKSSTEGSTKQFKLTIGDDGVLVVSEIE